MPEEIKETLEEAVARNFAVYIKDHEAEEMPSIARTVLEFIMESPLFSALDGIEFKQMVMLIWKNIDIVYNKSYKQDVNEPLAVEVQEMLNTWWFKVSMYIDYVFEEEAVQETVAELITKEQWSVEFRVLLQYLASYFANEMQDGSLLYNKYFCNILAYMGYYLSQKMQ